MIIAAGIIAATIPALALAAVAWSQDRRIQHLEHEVAVLLVDQGSTSSVPGSEVERRREQIAQQASA